MTAAWLPYTRPVLTVAQMQALDRLVIDTLGMPGPLLMENAARSVVAALLARSWPRPLRTVVILCGTGNNGGDGLAVARLLAAAGLGVDCRLVGDPAALSGEAALNHRLLGACGIPVTRVVEAAGLPFAAADLVVDALCGTGFRGRLDGLPAAVVEALNAADRPVLAIDIPSGLSGDSGQVPGPAVRAAVTVTLGFPKPGLLLFPAAEYVGELVVGALGFPAALAARVNPHLHQITEAVTAALPRRSLGGHKGENGRLLVLAGSPGMTGAAQYACRAARATGTGYVRLATGASLLPVFAATVPGVVAHGLPESQYGLHQGSVDQLLKLAENCDAALLGPGLGRSPDTCFVVCSFLKYYHGPVIVDADAIFALAEDTTTFDSRTGELIITPHYGEIARLLRTTAGEIAQDPLRIAGEVARDRRLTVVLKGPRALVALPTGETLINTSGTPALATAGSGDLLAGLIAAFRARGLAAPTATALGTWLHGQAGARAAAASHESLVSADDIATALPATLRDALIGV